MGRRVGKKQRNHGAKRRGDRDGVRAQAGKGKARAEKTKAQWMAEAPAGMNRQEKKAWVKVQMKASREVRGNSNEMKRAIFKVPKDEVIGMFRGVAYDCLPAELEVRRQYTVYDGNMEIVFAVVETNDLSGRYKMIFISGGDDYKPRITYQPGTLDQLGRGPVESSGVEIEKKMSYFLCEGREDGEDSVTVTFSHPGYIAGDEVTEGPEEGERGRLYRLYYEALEGDHLWESIPSARGKTKLGEREVTAYSIKNFNREVVDIALRYLTDESFWIEPKIAEEAERTLRNLPEKARVLMAGVEVSRDEAMEILDGVFSKEGVIVGGEEGLEVLKREEREFYNSLMDSDDIVLLLGFFKYLNEETAIDIDEKSKYAIRSKIVKVIEMKLQDHLKNVYVDRYVSALERHMENDGRDAIKNRGMYIELIAHAIWEQLVIMNFGNMTERMHRVEIVKLYLEFKLKVSELMGYGFGGYRHVTTEYFLELNQGERWGVQLAEARGLWEREARQAEVNRRVIMGAQEARLAEEERRRVEEEERRKEALRAANARKKPISPGSAASLVVSSHMASKAVMEGVGSMGSGGVVADTRTSEERARAEVAEYQARAEEAWEARVEAVSEEQRPKVVTAGEMEVLYAGLGEEDREVYDALMEVTGDVVTYEQILRLGEVFGIEAEVEGNRGHLPHNNPTGTLLPQRYVVHQVVPFIDRGYVRGEIVVSNLAERGIVSDHLRTLAMVREAQHRAARPGMRGVS